MFLIVFITHKSVLAGVLKFFFFITRPFILKL